jgi:fluoride exporter
MQGSLIVFLGAGIGGALRHAVNLACERLGAAAFPWGTLAVNVAGSFLMGVLAGWLAAKAEGEWTHPARLFLGTGVLGGFTTFSAFSLDVALLWERGAPLAAVTGYVAGSVALSIGGLLLGLLLVRSLA